MAANDAFPGSRFLFASTSNPTSSIGKITGISYQTEVGEIDVSSNDDTTYKVFVKDIADRTITVDLIGKDSTTLTEGATGYTGIAWSTETATANISYSAGPMFVKSINVRGSKGGEIATSVTMRPFKASA